MNAVIQELIDKRNRAIRAIEANDPRRREKIEAIEAEYQSGLEGAMIDAAEQLGAAHALLGITPIYPPHSVTYTWS